MYSFNEVLDFSKRGGLKPTYWRYTSMSYTGIHPQEIIQSIVYMRKNIIETADTFFNPLGDLSIEDQFYDVGS